MTLTWSHAVLYVRNLDAMLNFYTDVLGCQITDRGPMGPEGSPDIVFLSQNPDEHHQLAMVAVRKDEDPSNSLNHVAFRTGAFADVQALYSRLAPMDGINVNPLSHGKGAILLGHVPQIRTA